MSTPFFVFGDLSEESMEHSKTDGKTGVPTDKQTGISTSLLSNVPTSRVGSTKVRFDDCQVEAIGPSI